MQRTDSPIGAHSSANGVTELLDQTVETAHLAGDLKDGPRGNGTDGTESFRTSAHLSLPLLAQQSALPLVQTQLAQVKATGHEQSRDEDKQDDAYLQDGFHDVEVVDRYGSKRFTRFVVLERLWQQLTTSYPPLHSINTLLRASLR